MVSIIVPIYKVEAYLEKCIKSIQNQTYTDLEIILVEDGSPDGCGAICDKYAKEDKRIRVIHKENGGLSDARNKGLDIAAGEYIAFVDSDDYIHPKMIEILMYHLQKAGADLAVCGFRQVEENEEVTFPEYSIAEAVKSAGAVGAAEIFTGETVMNNLQHKNLLTVVAWNKLYKAELFKERRYPAGKIHEDEFIIHHILHRCKKTVYIKNELYYYLQRAGSIMGEIKYASVSDGWEAYRERLAFMQENQYAEMVLFTKLHMLHYICKFYQNLENRPEAEGLLSEWRNRFAELYEEKEVQENLAEEQARYYKYFVIRPQLYYNKKGNAEKRKARAQRIKQMVKNCIKR